MRHAGGWTAPPGTFSDLGEVVDYPADHYCRRALDRRDTILIENFADERPTTDRRAGETAWRDLGDRRTAAGPR